MKDFLSIKISNMTPRSTHSQKHIRSPYFKMVHNSMIAVMGHSRALQKSFMFVCIACIWVCLGDVWANGVVGVWEWAVNLAEIPNTSIVGGDTLQWDFMFSLKATAVELIYYAKILLNGLVFFALLWVGAVWILSMWEESGRTEWKWKFIISIVALVLINVPEVLYRIFTGSDSYTQGTIQRVSGKTIITTDPGGQFTEADFVACDNFLFCPYGLFNNVYVRWFFFALEVLMVVIAVIFFTFGGIKLMVSGGKEDSLKTARNRFIYGGIALLVVGFVEWLYRAVFLWGLVTGDVAILINIANVFLFFAWPIAIIFLIIWAYYYITSGGSQERADKGKKILLYTFLATILLLLSYTLIVEIVGGLDLI